jgi:hypothetical protein
VTFTFTDGQVVFSARSGSSDSTRLQLETSTTVAVRVPAGDPTGRTSGKLSRNLFNGSTGDGGELKTSVSASGDSLITSDSVGEDGELMSSSEGGQNGEKGSRRRDHCWLCRCVELGYQVPDDYLYQKPVAREQFPLVLQTLQYL